MHYTYQHYNFMIMVTNINRITGNKGFFVSIQIRKVDFVEGGYSLKLQTYTLSDILE